MTFRNALLFSFLCVFGIESVTLGQTHVRHEFKINGSVRGMQSGVVYINYLSGYSRGTFDSCEVINGRFSFSGRMKEPSYAHLSTQRFDKPPTAETNLDFYLEASNIRIDAELGKLRTALVKGSRANDDFLKLLNLESKYRIRLDELLNIQAKFSRRFDCLEKQSYTEDEMAEKLKADSIVTLIVQEKKKLAIVDSNFIVSNPNSYIALDLLSKANFEWFSFRTFRNLFSRFPTELKTSSKGERVSDIIKRETALGVGWAMVPFRGTTFRGDSVDISRKIGEKVILLDFGASWCAPCHELEPMIDELLRRYPTQLLVVTISVQDKAEDWRRYQARRNLSWPQMLESDIVFSDSSIKSISDEYLIETIPAMLLFDIHGKLIGKYGSYYFDSPQAYFCKLLADLQILFKEK